MLIAGRRISKASMQRISSPYDNRMLGEVAMADLDDLPHLIEVAREGSILMKRMPMGERASILETAAVRISQNEDLAVLLSSEVGKTIREARGEVGRCANTLKLSAEAGRQLCGRTVAFDLNGPSHKTGFYRYEPLGIVLAITPFNFPLNLAAHKIGPALAAGNSVIIKPATKTPLATIRMAEILIECGLPSSALSVVTGSGGIIGDDLVRHTDIRKISFTGSPEVGVQIARQAGLKKLTLELGSNAAVIIMPDTDLAKAAKKIRAAAFAVAGQVCISVQRVYVHESCRTSFLDLLHRETLAFRTGDPALETTDLGPMISESETRRVLEWIDEALAAGGQLICGGQCDGSVLQATVLADVPETCRVVREEIFAPVVIVNRFSTFEQAVDLVNDSKYGLQAAIFTNDLIQALRFTEEIKAGSVLVNETTNFRVDNMPYGGVKQSGIGREGPSFAIEEMSEKKLVILDY